MGVDQAGRLNHQVDRDNERDRRRKPRGQDIEGKVLVARERVAGETVGRHRAEKFVLAEFRPGGHTYHPPYGRHRTGRIPGPTFWWATCRRSAGRRCAGAFCKRRRTRASPPDDGWNLARCWTGRRPWWGKSWSDSALRLPGETRHAGRGSPAGSAAARCVASPRLDPQPGAPAQSPTGVQSHAFRAPRSPMAKATLAPVRPPVLPRLTGGTGLAGQDLPACTVRCKFCRDRFIGPRPRCGA